MNQKELLQKVLDASKLIDKSSRNSSGNYIITSKEVSNTITELVQEQESRKISRNRNKQIDELLK